MEKLLSNHKALNLCGRIYAPIAVFLVKQGNRQGCIVKLENHDGATYWRNLDHNERTFIGPDAFDIYNATISKVTANHVEWEVQLHVRDVLPDNVMLLQVKPGSGG